MDELLQILNANGQSFLQSFGDIPAAGPSTKRKWEEPESDSEEEEEEWGGIDLDEEEDDGDLNDNDNDDGFVADSSSNGPNVVVFTETSSSSKTTYDAAMKKSFMSSKVSKIKSDVTNTNDLLNADEEDEERSNTQNDALLHRLVHTKLLSGSLNSELDMTPAHRKKALAGRVLELAGRARLGKGEKSVRQEERSKHAKRVRTGLVDKEKERQKTQVEEAKNMGNYHRSIRKVFQDPDQGFKKRDRERGLRMGVGKFSGGMLKLSRDDISHVNGPAARGSRGGGHGRGRGRGRGGDRGSGRGGRGRGRG